MLKLDKSKTMSMSKKKGKLNGIVSTISSDLSAKMAITTVPFKALSDQVWIRYLCFCFFKVFFFICGFSSNVTCAFLAYRKQWKNNQK